MLSGDYAVPPVSVLKSALSSKKSQVLTTTSGGNRYISLNTKVKPLDNVNVRRALSAAIDRTALLQTRGGPTVGIIANHFIPPDIPGFEEAGGKKGPGFDFTPPTADLAVAQKYMKKAGYSSGKYTGPALLTIADNQSPAKETAEAFQEQVGKLGFKLQFREVPHATMLQKFCNVPKSAVAICPNLGWGKDFFDAQSFIDPLFNGKNIVPSGNVNTAQVNDPKINSEIEKAKTITNPTDRATAWGNLDKQVTDQSYFLTWTWDNYVGLMGTNVKGVQNAFNGGAWDLAYSSLK
jgi:peptide/nickel transport system substrate-binding protein